jgi:hypothetical protein
MSGEPVGNNSDQHTSSDEAPQPIEDLFDFDDDPVNFMSAESFPASDPAPPQTERDLPPAG